MEVRCGSCNKPFRVSDDKIVGTGIKFACTRCNESVKITKEAYEQYTLSKAAVSTLDMFEPQAKTVKAPLPPEGAAAVSTATAVAAETQSFDLSDSPEDDLSREAQAPQFFEPPSFAEPAHVAEAKAAPEPQKQQSLEPEEKPAIELKSETLSEPSPESKPAPAQRKSASQPMIEPKPAAARPAPTAAPRNQPSAAPTAPKKEPARPEPPAAEKTIGEAIPAPSRSRNWYLILIVTIIILGLAGYAVFWKSAPPVQERQERKEAADHITSMEGLRIENPSGSMDAAGDLLITGVIENSTDTERPAWYVVVDILDARGSVLTRIKLLNGRQIYSHRDYDILETRGVNTQELKSKNLLTQGVVIPPRGSAPFEIRCLLPPVGIASFNATLQPYDPERLFKELAEDMK